MMVSLQNSIKKIEVFEHLYFIIIRHTAWHSCKQKIKTFFNVPVLDKSSSSTEQTSIPTCGLLSIHPYVPTPTIAGELAWFPSYS